MALGRWAVQFAFEDLRPHEVDPITLTWWMHRRIDEERLPPGRVVIQFDHTAPERLSLWMVLDRGEASVCVQHPGFDTDLLVTTTTPALAEVFSGFCSLERAIATETIRLDGTPALIKGFHRWFMWSPFVDQTRAMVAEMAGDPSA
jgi:hypothetical protein